MTSELRKTRWNVKLWVALWFSLTLCSSVLNIASWVYRVDGGVQLIANFFYMLTLPGWIVLYGLGFIGVRDLALGILLANGVSWFMWIAVVLFLCRKREGACEKDQSEVSDVSRRRFLSDATLGTLCVGVGATNGYATLIEPQSIKIRRYTIAIKGLPSSFDGLKLVQLADTHLGPRIPESFVKSAVDMVNNEHPDVVLLTGDHIHDGVNEIERATELIKPLVDHSSIGVIGVLGNHDWWGDGHQLSQALQSVGVHMIDNDRIWLDEKSRSIHTEKLSEDGVAFVGFGDLTDHYIDLKNAFRDIDHRTPRIVLSHNPDSAEMPELSNTHEYRVDLMCSGHTHGGQVRIPFIGTPIVPSAFGSKYAGGLVQGPAFPVHISRGIGMSLLPVRVGVPPEISVITLRAEKLDGSHNPTHQP